MDTVAVKRSAPRNALEFFGVLRDITGRRIHFFNSNWIAVLGRAIVIDEHDRSVGIDC